MYDFYPPRRTHQNLVPPSASRQRVARLPRFYSLRSEESDEFESQSESLYEVSGPAADAAEA